MLRIEPVGRADRERALALLLGGRQQPAAASFSGMLAGPDAGRCLLWWARTRRGPRAAALTIRNPGRCALIFQSPSQGCPRRVLPRLLGELTEATLAGGAGFVQALLEPGCRGDAQAYLRAGYLNLAQLLYLTRWLKGPVQEGRGPELEWLEFRPGQESQLERIIADTYVESLDCPSLLGRRPLADVIASHKACGVFRPQSWWLPACAGQPVGCVLANDSPAPGAAEIVYLGVRPAFRRRGFGRRMLRHALADAAARGLGRVELAVDAANIPAAELYRQEGFVQLDRRDVFIRYGQQPARAGAPGGGASRFLGSW